MFADGAVGPDLASLGEEDVAALGQVKVIGVTGAALPAEDQRGGAVDVLTADQRHVLTVVHAGRLLVEQPAATTRRRGGS